MCSSDLRSRGDGAAPQPEPVVPVTRPVTLPATGEPGSALTVIRADIGECTRCKLHTLGRQQIVFGVGDPQARLMFVGEAPGADEDVQGEPFVGRAGQLLTKIIEAIQLTRSQVYIANVIKCRPPQNRNPEPDEVAQCGPYLERQVAMVQPKLILAMGRFAVQSLLAGSVPQVESQPLGKLRGQVYAYHGVPVVVTYHPAYLLRSLNEKSKAWADLCLARAQL